MSDCGSPFKPAEALADGEHVFRVEAVDHVGNASGRAERTFVVDSVAPVTAAEGVADGTLTNDATPTYALTADEEGATFLCAVDDAEPTPCDASYTPVALTDGKHTLRFTAVDRAGTPDATPEVRTLTVDTTAPETAITSGPAEGSSGLGTSATFVFAGGEGYVCSLDGGAPSSCSSPLTITGLTVGPHKLVVAALDAAGNADATPVVRTFTVLAPLGGAFFGTPALTKRTVSYRKKRLKTLKFALSCPAGAMRGCTGTAVLEAGKKTLGVGRFTLRGGESGTLTIELGRTGRKRLAKAKRTGAVLTVTPKGAAVGKLPVTLRRR
jgi:hypothetical protein